MDTNEFRQLDQHLSKINESICESNVKQAKLDTQIDTLNKQVESVSRTLMQGNGQPSVVTRMALVEQRMSTLHSWLEEELQEIKGVCQRLEAKHQQPFGNSDRIQGIREWHIAVFAGGIALLGNLGNLLDLLKKLLA